MAAYILIDHMVADGSGIFPVYGWGATLREAINRAGSGTRNGATIELHAVGLTPGALAFCETARCCEDIARELEYDDAADPIEALYRSDLAGHVRELCQTGDAAAVKALDSAPGWIEFLKSTCETSEPDYHYTRLCAEKAEALRLEVRADRER